MFPTPLQPLTEMYSCTRGIIWRKCSLNNCTVLYFSEIKWFREHFWSYYVFSPCKDQSESVVQEGNGRSFRSIIHSRRFHTTAAAAAFCLLLLLILLFLLFYLWTSLLTIAWRPYLIPRVIMEFSHPTSNQGCNTSIRMFSEIPVANSTTLPSVDPFTPSH